MPPGSPNTPSAFASPKTTETMEQKIKVEVTAANDQWPKMIDSTVLNESPEGTVATVNSMPQLIHSHVLSIAGWQSLWVKESGDLPTFSGTLCFNSQESFCEWWSNPQPVKAEPEKVPIKSLKAGDFFVAADEIFLRSTCQHNPSVSNAGSSMAFPDNHLVTPFKGTITITVE